MAGLNFQQALASGGLGGSIILGDGAPTIAVPQATQIPFSQTSAGRAASQAAASRAAAQNDTLLQLADTEGNLNRLLGNLDVAQRNGLTTISDNYNRDLGRENEKYGQALSGYSTQRVDNNQGRADAYRNVDNNASNLNTSVRSILGLAGAGRSSAGLIAAPTLISNDASAKRTNVTNTFGKNDRNIATAEDKTKLSYQNLLTDLLAQRKQKEADFLGGIEGQRNQYRGQLGEVAGQRAVARGGGYEAVRAAQAPIKAAIAASDANVNNLAAGARTAYNVSPLNVAAASIDPFAVDKSTLNAAAETGAAQSEAYAQQLRKRLQEGATA